MRQPIKILLTIFFLFVTTLQSNSALKGNLEYNIPIDYTNLNEEELSSKADFYYNNALNNTTGKIDDNITSALNLFAILSNKSPDNITYAIKLGSLYDLIKKDRYAKGSYYRAMGIDNSRPEPYFYLGEFYYKRQMYRKALKMYNLAYEHGYNMHYLTLYKLGDIYQKLGDTQEAQNYLQLAATFESSIELDKKIEKLNTIDTTNKEYYRK